MNFQEKYPIKNKIDFDNVFKKFMEDNKEKLQGLQPYNARHLFIKEIKEVQSKSEGDHKFIGISNKLIDYMQNGDALYRKYESDIEELNGYRKTYTHGFNLKTSELMECEELKEKLESKKKELIKLKRQKIGQYFKHEGVFDSTNAMFNDRLYAIKKLEGFINTDLLMINFRIEDLRRL